MKKFYFLILLFAGTYANAQLVNNGGTITIEAGGKILVSGDVISSTSIQGTGTLLMNGTTKQTLTMNGNAIPNLEVNNANNVILGSGSTTITTALNLTTGKVRTANQDLILAATATINGAGAGKFIWTDGTGSLKRQVTADVADYLFPLGDTTSYLPAFVTATGGSYANAYIAVQAKSNASDTRPPMITNYIKSYWPINKTGITGGTVSIKGQYENLAVVGAEDKLSGYYFNGTDFTSVGGQIDTVANQVSINLSTDAGALYSINKFIAVGAKVFLQGPYNTSTGLMSDALRAGTNLIPLTDPYRTSPYNATFAHVDNTAIETAADSVFADKANANDNIVDWVFLELRNTNASPGNVVLQTRSALVQRDGDIVDVDGVSPVTFNNVPAGNYAISVRHRNHLGISLDPVASPKAFNETKSLALATNSADLRTATDAQIFGSSSAFATATHPTLGTVAMLWSGNVNSNNSVKFQGPGNDRAPILTDLNNNELSILTGYYRADLNMNRTVRFQGPSNDRSFLLSNVLGSQELNIKNEELPK